MIFSKHIFLTDAQLSDVLGLMLELDPERIVTAEMLQATLASPTAHFLAAVDNEDHIVGCATLCEFVSPTGRKASVEDVVVSAKCRGQHIGRQLMDFMDAQYIKDPKHLYVALTRCCQKLVVIADKPVLHPYSV